MPERSRSPEKQILKNVSIEFPKNQVTALIGPSECGKSTLLRTFNRLHDLIPYARIEGQVSLDGLGMYLKNTKVTR